MEGELKVTVVTEVEPPELERIVELRRLRTADGGPVRVRCARIDRFALGKELKTLPAAIAVPEGAASAEDVEEFLPIARILIELGTFLAAADGASSQRAFWFTREIPGALPGAWLETDDLLLLAKTHLELGGYVGGAADEAGFPARGDRRADGAGAVEVREGAGALAEGGAAGTGSAVQPDGDAGA